MMATKEEQSAKACGSLLSPQPPAHARLFVASKKLKSQAEEVEKDIAVALGYFTAGLRSDVSAKLAQLLPKIKLINSTVNDLNAIKQDVAELVGKLKELQRCNEALKKENKQLLERLSAFDTALTEDMQVEVESPKAKRKLLHDDDTKMVPEKEKAVESHGQLKKDNEENAVKPRTDDEKTDLKKDDEKKTVDRQTDE